jgi:hypothetical protein
LGHLGEALEPQRASKWRKLGGQLLTTSDTVSREMLPELGIYWRIAGKWWGRKPCIWSQTCSVLSVGVEREKKMKVFSFTQRFFFFFFAFIHAIYLFFILLFTYTQRF